MPRQAATTSCASYPGVLGDPEMTTPALAQKLPPVLQTGKPRPRVDMESGWPWTAMVPKK